MLLTNIDHVAIAVRDLEAAIAYYAEAFGAEVHHREIVESDGVEEALVKVADSYIQLTAATRPDSPIAKSIEKRGEGLHHIGYRVDDCAAALAAMVAAGATPIDQAPRPGSRGTTVAFIHPKGSFGTLIELVQEKQLMADPEVHLVDGTYELFRYFYSPGGGHENREGLEVGAVRGVLRSMVSMLSDGATHVGVATDHVIESFRNKLYAPYKDGSGIDPLLFAQFPLLERALEAAGFTVWAMVEFEADDALAAAAAVAAADPSISRAIICTPDKDLAQCVHDPDVIQFDRRASVFRDEQGVIDKFGVAATSIPDWLALVGDSADGFPGLAGWGAKSAAAVLSRYPHLEDIPLAAGQWDITVRSAAKLCATLGADFDNALLFRILATLRRDIEVGTPAMWRWTGPREGFADICAFLDAADVERKVSELARRF